MMANPAMMQGMMGNPAMPNAPPAAPFQPGAAAPNPFQQRMQQVMNDPVQMQQALAMTQQMFNRPQGQANAPFPGFNPGAFGAPPVAPAGEAAAPNAAPNPAPNPMQQMMQQMMGNPALMQQVGQQMSGGQQGAAAVSDEVLKVRFASQLVQLAGMGFSDESMCLRALAQHNGRLDSAIDVLLSGGVQ